MSMSALLSKLSQTASPAPANTVSQPFPGPPTSGPGPGFPPMNGGQHLYPANGGIPDTLHHSNSWSVGQIPSLHPHPHSHHMGTTSPQRAPVYPHQMGGIASPRIPNQSSGTHDAADLTASLKQMLGLGAASSPNRGPSDGNVSNAMTPGAHRNGPAQHPMTPTRRFDDPQSFHHGETPPPIHLAPALNNLSGRSRSPLQMPSVHQSTLSGNSSQPPSRHSSQRQVQTNSPHNTFTSPATQARHPHHGYVPNPNRNGDPFTIGTSSGDAGVHTINKNGVAHAVVDTWNKSTHKDGLMEENGAPNEDDKEQKRDFVRALLSAIHTDESFVNQLWKEYCDSQGGGKGADDLAHV
ncbi:hypothetical protein QFC21_006381 [Naganishia friedmannii]|uniref:Uncharacterized protein n=1 Tax=Naganishia friedmannii TaxID=89922 RepID=A0ACC2V3Q7_9TREE|nr:hypothetical protein QFC21_006381 [Naganishia friedmannii]